MPGGRSANVKHEKQYLALKEQGRTVARPAMAAEHSLLARWVAP